MQYNAIIFDLDGTLLDTLEDIGDAMNATLERIGHPPHPMDRYRRFVGDGIETLAQRALPQEHRSQAEVDACVLAMREEYGENWNRKTRPYPGILELLKRLQEADIVLSVLSNKPDDFTQATVNAYFPADLFRIAAGIGPGFPAKPDPSGARRIIKMLGIAPERILFVGDTDTDMQTALGAGIVPIGVSWGFRPVEELQKGGAARIIDTPDDLLGIVGILP